MEKNAEGEIETTLHRLGFRALGCGGLRVYSVEDFGSKMRELTFRLQILSRQ